MIDFSKKRFLVVDDFSEFRSSIKGILRLLAVQHIDTAGTGDEVLELCRRHRYDVILHDYNLGDRLNGQQVLEQLQAENLLAPQCIFIMVTAENTQAMVLAALECEPDDYLTKPFNKVTLQTRLERLVRRKQVLAPVLKALHAGDHAAVLRACHSIQQQDPRHAVLCQRYMAAALEGLGHYQQLEHQLEQLARSRPSGWNLQALARLWLRQGRLAQAERLLQAAVRQFPLLPELRELQAELALRQDDPPGVQAALQQALDLSPNSLRRQIAMARQAWLNDAPEVALRALRQCWEVGRHAPQFDHELLWQLAALLARGQSGKFPDEAQPWLALLDKAARQTPRLQPLLAVLQLEQQRRQGVALADAAVQPLIGALQARQSGYALLTQLLLGDWLATLDQPQAAALVWQLAIERHPGVAGLPAQLQRRLPQLDMAPLQQGLRLGREAEALHWQEQSAQAEAQFDAALQLAPSAIEVNMAAARLYRDQLQQGQPDADLRLQECLRRLGELSALEAEYPELQRLQSALEFNPW